MIVYGMLFHPVVHPKRADIGIVFEQDPPAAQAMRAKFFPMAAAESSFVRATHTPFPAHGQIGRDEGTLHWFPENWPYTS
ncbi:MAG: hypothetical protein AAGF27_03380 [Pseudomonadota bacterium]